MLLAPRLWNCLTILRDASGSSPRRLSPVHFCSSASRWHYSRGTHLLFWGQLRWTSTMNFYHFNCLCILYYCITVSLYYCIIVYIISLYYCIIVLLYHCITFIYNCIYYYYTHAEIIYIYCRIWSIMTHQLQQPHIIIERPIIISSSTS